MTGARGSVLESFNANVYLADRRNDWGLSTAGASRDDRQADFSFGFTLRGGWQLGTGISVEGFGYPASLYANYWIERRGAVVDTIRFTGQPHIANLDLGANIATPRLQNFSLSAFVLAGHDENFLEWASAQLQGCANEGNVQRGGGIGTDEAAIERVLECERAGDA